MKIQHHFFMICCEGKGKILRPFSDLFACDTPTLKHLFARDRL